MALNEATLLALLTGGETATVEFKLAPPRPLELAERICALANTATGGYLIIGVEDSTWRPVGVKRPPDVIDALLTAARYCTPVVHFVPPLPEVHTLEGKPLVVATIPPSEGTLYRANKVFWIRRGTQSIALESEELERFFYRRGSLAWETRLVDNATLDDLDLARVEEYAGRRFNRRQDAPQTLLVKSRFAAVNPETGSATPTRAGMLLLGKHPQDFIPQAEVRCVLYGDPDGLRRFLDRRTLRGTLTEQIDQTADFFTRHLSTSAHMEGFRRVDEPEYPLEALREAVVNALVHRDYSLEGEAVRVFFYPNRIEVHSPGLLLPGLTLDMLRAGQAFSRPRNPALATGLYELPGGYMERLGSGISFMIAQMKQAGKPPPVFSEPNEFIVTFYRSSAGITNALVPDTSTPTVLSASPVTVPPLERRQGLGLDYVNQHGAITNREYRALTGVSESTAMRDLEGLVEAGILRISGNRRARKYLR